MSKSVFLAAKIEHRVGTLDLRASFQLDKPWTVLFGPSGAGKSTILRILAGLMVPTNGTITLQNRVLLQTDAAILLPPGRRGIGFVAQQPALFPHVNVHRNIAFGLQAMDSSQRQQRVDEMLKLFRIEALAARMPAELSGGERQRVALARALAPQPSLLLLDEPFSGLDALLKESILSELTSWLQARTLPALYVSHDVAEAYQTAAEVIVMENGRIEQQGPVQDVLASRRQHLLQQLGVFNQPTPVQAPDESQTSPQPPR